LTLRIPGRVLFCQVWMRSAGLPPEAAMQDGLATVIIPQIDDDIVKGKGIDPVMLKSILRRVLSVTRPQKIILFGSAARGDAGPDSDIDLLVLGNVSHRGRTAQRIYRRLVGVGAPVDVVVATPEDIEKYKDSAGTFFRRALREGKVVYAA